MLTLLETVDAIKALDTPTDVLTQACERILQKQEGLVLTDKQMAKEIVEKYNKQLPIAEILNGLLMAAGVGAALACKPGREPIMLMGLLTGLKSYFTETMNDRLGDKLKEDPKSSIDDLLTVLEALRGIQ